MASYPGSVVTWEDKTDIVDDVHASHVNGAYAEIIAIETNLDSHKSDSMPHQFVDNSTTYNYGLKAKNGELIFMYEEAT